MWIKSILLIIFALFIDATQILVAWMFIAIGTGLQLITPAGGAAGGAAVGVYLCWNTSAGVVSGVIAAVKCGVSGAIAGAVISALGVPIGTGFGFLIDVCISLTMGGGLILALIMSGMFYPKYVWGGAIVEFLPGFDIIPGWTAMVIFSIMEKSKQEGGALGAVSGVALAVASPSFKNITSALTGVKSSTTAMQSGGSRGGIHDNSSEQGEVQTRRSLELKSPSIKNDIAPRQAANDNHPAYVQKAA